MFYFAFSSYDSSHTLFTFFFLFVVQTQEKLFFFSGGSGIKFALRFVKRSPEFVILLINIMNVIKLQKLN